MYFILNSASFPNLHFKSEKEKLSYQFLWYLIYKRGSKHYYSSVFILIFMFHLFLLF